VTANSFKSRPSALPVSLLQAAAAASAAVDMESRFPVEAMTEIRAHGLLGALVPKAFGGQGSSVGRVAAQCQSLARSCSSSAMILAMHHIQVACIVGHGRGSYFEDLLRRIASDQLLVASATSEVGVGGSMRTSLCAIETDGHQFGLTKKCSAISFGRYADAVLVTARSGPLANESDQILAAFERRDLQMEKTGAWDAMGMRGTVTEPFVLRGSASTDHIFPSPFGDIAAQTMTPLGHILWAACWTGIAGDAVLRARSFLRKTHDARSDRPTQGAYALAEAVETLQMAEARLRQAMRTYEASGGQTPGFADTAGYNSLKISVADACLAVVQKAMTACGFVGYSRSGRYSVERHLRDLCSAPLMIANSRIRENSAWLVLTQAPSVGLDLGFEE
jgi:acyl-CoA dehydrogenase